MADNASQQGQDLADSVKNMATQLPGGPAAGAAMVAKGIASKIHEMVGSQNDRDNTDGSKPNPTLQAHLNDQDWSKLMTAPNNKGRVNK